MPQRWWLTGARARCSIQAEVISKVREALELPRRPTAIALSVRFRVPDRQLDEMNDYPREIGRVALGSDGDPWPAIGSMTALVEQTLR